ncbi:hypothetical protein L6164_032960 [Bauhinia variegata]|uniref:Uncharacterized protein n=1 Tax=Bauhinia variegata TaxID=167791 RepID=A0ACB9KR38_BAUVA|nr:hypothetical protein L6164_032960 [Bauhinia variegata]
MSTGACQPLYHDIRAFFDEMNMGIDQQFPVFIVPREALNNAIAGENNDFHHMPETRGLCLSEDQTVNCIMRRPRIGSNRLIGMRTNPQKLTRNCQVTAIVILCGLPRLLTGAILAHELMRAWLRLKGYRNRNPEVEEGIYHVLSKMWLESEMTPSSLTKKAAKPDIEKKLSEFFIHQISNDSFPGMGVATSSCQ